jgi:hypothetical protein
MSNKSKKPKKKQPKEKPQEPAIPPEPEGGPFEREQAFLGERLSELRPKEEEERGEESFGSLLPVAPEAADQPRKESEEKNVAAERKRALKQYRRQQRQKMESDKPEEKPGARPENLADLTPPPPMAPVPPPANNWVPIGPSVLRKGQAAVLPATSGRTPAIAVAPGGTRIYIGAANGGVWRSDDTGRTWLSLMDAFDRNPTTPASDSLSVGAIAIDPANPDRVYVGSGEGPGGTYFGVGPIVSNNGTQNPYGPTPPAWVTEQAAAGSPSLEGTAFYALALDPGDANRVVAGTRRGLYRREPNGAGGFHWAVKALPGAGSTWVTSVVAAAASAATTLYAACWFGPVYSSSDGQTWTVVGTGFPTTNVGRIGLAVRPTDPGVVYALVAYQNPANNMDPLNGSILGVWRLDTSDNTWRPVTGHPTDLFGTSAIGFQGSYDLAIAVDPNNANRIYMGGSSKQSGGEWSGSLYRADVTSSGTSPSITHSMTNTYLGSSVHGDIHTLVFTPGDSNKLWLGCDGGVFYSTNPTGSGDIFQARNTGLATLTMNHMDQHPSEDAVLFVGTQDNGGDRFTGEEAWLHSLWGDAGFFVINWNDPFRILVTYVRAFVNRTTDGGTRYNYSGVNVPIGTDPVFFYAPLVGTPRNPAAPAQAERVAFGSNRPWISDTFGGSWVSIPNNNTTDQLGTGNNFRIRSMVFASHTRLYVGLVNGQIYRYDQGGGGAWGTPTRIDNVGGLALAGVVTDIAVDPADATGSSIYITFGGTGDYRHVWHFDGTQWQQRSGPSAGNLSSLLDVQANAIIVDPANTNHVYVGADIGVWQSTDGGNTWQTFSEGLPDAAVLDLKIHAGRRLLRASTHGRSVYERTLDPAPKLGVELFVRDTQLDQGRFATVNGLPDPTAMGQTVRHWAGPDIKLDTPDTMGQYQFPLTGTIDFHQFVDTLSDDARNVATHATATIMTRVYVQVHNRGVLPADGVRVMLLLANASAGLPALPAGYWINVQNGTPINTANWHTLGIVTLNDVRVGAPKIAAFDLPSNMLPPPASLTGNNHHCVLALIHHPNDQYTSMITNTDNNSLAERKAAHKNLTVLQFTGTLPAPPPIIFPFRIHNAELEQEIITGIRFSLGRYSGRGRLYSPPLRTVRPLEEVISGLKINDDFESFRVWAEEHTKMIRENLESNNSYDKEWSLQRIEEIERSFESGLMFQIEGGTDEVQLKGIQMEPDSYHTFFLSLDRPENGEIGENYVIDILQTNEETADVAGGLTVRVELVKEPEIGEYRLELWQQKWQFGYTIIRARLYDPANNLLSPDEGAAVQLLILDRNRWFEVQMRWHSSWNSFYYFSRGLKISRVIATGLHNGINVVEVHLGTPEIRALAKTPERELKTG